MTDPRPDVAAYKTGIRLQKVLAQAGVASRRACEELIVAGRVSVNGAVVTALGTRVDPTDAVIRVDGARIPVAPGQHYRAMNKPRGVITTMSDEHGRPCVGDLVADQPVRLFPVGRLDGETEGLLLFTNDGDLAHRLAHPSFEVAKTYLAEVEGPIRKGVGEQLRRGIELDDGLAKVDRWAVVAESGPRVQVQLTLHSGRNRIVRRMLEAVGHPVKRLVRLTFGPIHLGQQAPGTLRDLTNAEVGELLDLVDLPG